MGKLKIFNSLTRKKEVFRAGTNKKVGVYVCGITPYDITHLGHAFTYVFFDVLVRYLRYLGYKVTYVQNLTDVDDDLLKKAKELKKNWKELAEENANKFLKEMNWIGNLQPDVYPKATDHISEMIRLIKKVFSCGVAYKEGGNVYFSIAKYKEYGKLSKLSRKRMIPISAERGADPKDPNKKDPLDFILWQKKKKGEPFWPSPWGQGRPGWHIECSAMSHKYLGRTVDIQGGGGDLIFPHHESSVSQSECALCKRAVRYWMHTGMLRYQGKKMSKSLGNMVFISDLKKKYGPNTVRIFLLSHHYRSAWEYFEKDIRKAKEVNTHIQKAQSRLSGSGGKPNVNREEKEFFKAMEDDFNTPKALKALERLAKKIIRAKSQNLAEAKAFLNKAFNILGLVIEYE